MHGASQKRGMHVNGLIRSFPEAFFCPILEYILCLLAVAGETIVLHHPDEDESLLKPDFHAG